MEEKITLYQFPRPRMVANLSFFCMKVEVFMKMTSIPYTIQEILNPAQAPKGKLPYITIEDIKFPTRARLLNISPHIFP